MFLEDFSSRSRFNEIYAEFFSGSGSIAGIGMPAQTAYEVGALPLGAKIEIEAIAALESR